jgi:hypothetical protein
MAFHVIKYISFGFLNDGVHNIKLYSEIIILKFKKRAILTNLISMKCNLIVREVCVQVKVKYKIN